MDLCTIFEDYKLKVIQCAPLENYPIQNVRDQLAMQPGGQKFNRVCTSHCVHGATKLFQRVIDQKLAAYKMSICVFMTFW